MGKLARACRVEWSARPAKQIVAARNQYGDYRHENHSPWLALNVRPRVKCHLAAPRGRLIPLQFCGKRVRRLVTGRRKKKRYVTDKRSNDDIGLDIEHAAPSLEFCSIHTTAPALLCN